MENTQAHTKESRAGDLGVLMGMGLRFSCLSETDGDKDPNAGVGTKQAADGSQKAHEKEEDVGQQPQVSKQDQQSPEAPSKWGLEASGQATWRKGG